MLRNAAVFAVEESLERLKVERADVLGERHLPEVAMDDLVDAMDLTKAGPPDENG
jgi:hypothetical protein